jgi:hypothetical protein
MNKKLLNSFVEISDNLKSFIKDHELWLYHNSYDGDNEEKALKNLLDYIKENLDHQYFCTIYRTAYHPTKPSDDGDQEMFFGDKQTVEEKLQDYPYFKGKYSFTMLFNIKEDKEAFIILSERLGYITCSDPWMKNY